MQVIYKYESKNGLVTLPKKAIILRQDHVDDGFYLGDFVWAIVDSTDTDMWTIHFKQDSYTDGQWLAKLYRVQVAVKEKQEVLCRQPIFAQETDGHINIYCADWGEEKEHTIVVYKTGQQIKEDVSSLMYLGLNRLWIIQELGLYTFEVLN